jgi:hypothetical protein
MTVLRSIAANDLVKCDAEAQGGTQVLAGVSGNIRAAPPISARTKRHQRERPHLLWSLSLRYFG